MLLKEMINKHIVSVVGELPNCDICHTHIARYDAKTVSGPWGYMCHNCWLKFRAHNDLGTGKGQILLTFDEGQELKGNNLSEEELVITVLSKDCKYDLQTLQDHMLAMKDTLIGGNVILIKAGSLPECLQVDLGSEDAYQQINDQVAALLNKSYVGLRDITYYNVDSFTISFKADDDPENDYSTGNFFNNYPAIVVCKEDYENDCLIPFSEEDLISIANILYEYQPKAVKKDAKGVSSFTL